MTDETITDVYTEAFHETLENAIPEQNATAPQNKATFTERPEDQTIFLAVPDRSFMDKVFGGYNYRQAPDQIDGSLVEIYNDFLKKLNKNRASDLNEEEKALLMGQINRAIVDYTSQHPQGHNYIPYQSMKDFERNFIKPMDVRKDKEEVDLAIAQAIELAKAEEGKLQESQSDTDFSAEQAESEVKGNQQDNVQFPYRREGDEFADAPWRAGIIGIGGNQQGGRGSSVEAESPMGIDGSDGSDGKEKGIDIRVDHKDRSETEIPTIRVVRKEPAEKKPADIRVEHKDPASKDDAKGKKIDVNEQHVYVVTQAIPAYLQKKLKEMGLLDKKEKFMNSRKLREKLAAMDLTDAQLQELQTYCDEEYRKIRRGDYSKKAPAKEQAPVVEEKIFSPQQMVAGLKCPQVGNDVSGWTMVGNNSWDKNEYGRYYKVSRGVKVIGPDGKEQICNEYLIRDSDNTTKKVYGKYEQYPKRIPDPNEILFCKVTDKNGVVTTYDNTGKLVKTENPNSNQKGTPVNTNSPAPAQKKANNAKTPTTNEGR